MSRGYVMGLTPSQRGGQGTCGPLDCLEFFVGMSFANTVRYISQEAVNFFSRAQEGCVKDWNEKL